MAFDDTINLINKQDILVLILVYALSYIKFVLFYENSRINTIQ